MISSSCVLLQLMLGTAMASWMQPWSLMQDGGSGPMNSTVLQAKFDLNLETSKDQTVSTVVQVGEEALVGCIATDHGREVAIARLVRASGSEDAAVPRLEFAGPGIENGTLFVPLEDHATGLQDGCDATSSFIAVGDDLVEFVAKASSPPVTGGIPAWTEYRWEAANVTSGEIHAIGHTNAFGEGSALADIEDGFTPISGSHVSLVNGTVRCVGMERESETDDDAVGRMYCWDTRLPAGNQIVHVAGADLEQAMAWVWADRYLVTLGHINYDHELFWTDMSVATAQPKFDQLSDNTGSIWSFMPDDIADGQIRVLSDDLLCWLTDTEIVDDDPGNNKVHCHSISANNTFILDESIEVYSRRNLAAAAVNGTVYVAAGAAGSVWAWELPGNTVTKLEDHISQTRPFQVQALAAVSDEAGVLFGFYAGDGSTRKTAVTWKVGQDPKPIDGLALDAEREGQAGTAAFIDEAEDITPWNDVFATFLMPDILVQVNRTSGAGSIIPGTENAYVPSHVPLHVEYEDAQGGQAHGFLFFMQPDTTDYGAPDELHFYSFTDEQPAVAAAKTCEPGLSRQFAFVDASPFASVHELTGSGARTSVAITPYKRSSGDELLVIKPAAIAEAGARVPEEEILYNPSPTFTGDSSKVDSVFTRRDDGAMCTVFDNGTLLDYACIVEGPRASDGAVRLDFASEMPMHPLVDPNSDRALAYKSQRQFDQVARLQFYKRGLGKGFVLFEQASSAEAGMELYYFDGHHSPVMLGSPGDFGFVPEGAVEATEDGHFVYFAAYFGWQDIRRVVADVSNGTFSKTGTSLKAAEPSNLYSKVAVVYDRFFVDILKIIDEDAADDIDEVNDLVAWDTHDLEAGPKTVGGGSITDDEISELYSEYVPNIWQVQALMGGTTGEVVFGIKHEKNDDADDLTSATYAAGNEKAMHFFPNGTLDDITDLNVDLVGASPGEWYHGPNGTGVVSSTTGERGVIAVSRSKQGGEYDMTLSLWNSRGLNEPLVNFTVPEDVRHAFVLDDEDVLIMTVAESGSGGGGYRRILYDYSYGVPAEVQLGQLLHLDVVSGELLEVDCESRFLPVKEAPHINRVGSDAVCWEPYSNADGVDNDVDPVNQLVVCYFKGDNECKVFDLGEDTIDAGSVHPFARVPRADPMDTTVAVAMILDDAKLGQEPAIMALVAPSPTPSPTPSASSSPSISPTASVSSSPSISPTASVSSSPSISPTASVSSSPSISPTASVSSSPSVSPTASVSSSPSTSPSSSVLAGDETCSDGVKNGVESDIDCGDPKDDSCALCSEGRACMETSNCAGELVCSSELGRCTVDVIEAGVYIKVSELQIGGITPAQFVSDLQGPFKTAVRDATGAEQVIIEKVAAAAGGGGGAASGSGRRAQGSAAAVDIEFSLRLPEGADGAASEARTEAYVQGTSGSSSLEADLQAAAPGLPGLTVQSSSVVIERETVSGSVNSGDGSPGVDGDGEDSDGMDTIVIIIIVAAAVVVIAIGVGTWCLCRGHRKPDPGKATGTKSTGGSSNGDPRPAFVSNEGKGAFSSEMV